MHESTPMLSLRSFHVFLIAAALTLSAATGAWAFVNARPWLAICGVAAAAVLAVYLVAFVRKSRTLRID